MNIGQLIDSYGYWALFLLVMVESLGVPLPGETALIIAGTYAGTTHHLNPWLIFAVASAAAIIGDNIGFWIGDTGGYRLARRYGSKVRLDERKLKTARYLFDRHGTKVVFFGRFVSVLRTYAAFLAGTSRMRWRKFLPANAAGGIVWAGIYTALSYLAGSWRSTGSWAAWPLSRSSWWCCWCAARPGSSPTAPRRPIQGRWTGFPAAQSPLTAYGHAAPARNSCTRPAL